MLKSLPVCLAIPIKEWQKHFAVSSQADGELFHKIL